MKYRVVFQRRWTDEPEHAIEVEADDRIAAKYAAQKIYRRQLAPDRQHMADFAHVRRATLLKEAANA